MNGIPWQPVGKVDARSLGEARRQVRNMAQWLARIASSYVDVQPRTRRLILEWRDNNPGLATQAFADGLRLQLSFPDLVMQFAENGVPTPHQFHPKERSPAEAEAWLLVELLHRGVDRSRFSKRLPYEIPDLMTGDAEDYIPEGCEDGLAELAAWFTNAARLIVAPAGPGAVAPGPLQCWPQNLHLTGRVAAESQGQFVRVGFSPGASGEEPYFFVGKDAGDDPDPPRALTIFPTSRALATGDPATAIREFLLSTR
jgi:hypothetical protein